MPLLGNLSHWKQNKENVGETNWLINTLSMSMVKIFSQLYIIIPTYYGCDIPGYLSLSAMVLWPMAEIDTSTFQ